MANLRSATSILPNTERRDRRFEAMRRSEEHTVDGAKFPVSEAHVNAAGETMHRPRDFLASRFRERTSLKYRDAGFGSILPAALPWRPTTNRSSASTASVFVSERRAASSTP
jgi:hypothetical protein